MKNINVSVPSRGVGQFGKLSEQKKKARSISKSPRGESASSRNWPSKKENSINKQTSLGEKGVLMHIL